MQVGIIAQAGDSETFCDAIADGDATEISVNSSVSAGVCHSLCLSLCALGGCIFSMLSPRSNATILNELFYLE